MVSVASSIARPLAIALAVLCAVAPRDRIAAQTAAARSDSAAQPSVREDVAPESPRASLERYLELARSGRFTEAAGYLDLPDSLREDGPTLARDLKAVLDRHLWIDLAQVSPSALGDAADGLPRGVEQIGVIPAAGGVRHPVLLTRAGVEGEARWRFSRGTVQRIPTWYAGLGNRWLLEHMPAALLRPGPLELLWWQWLAVPLLLAVAAVLGYVLSWSARALFTRVVRRTTVAWDDAILDRLGLPLTAGFTCVAAAVMLPSLGLYAPAAAATSRLLRAAFLLVFFWTLWRLIDVAHESLTRTRWAITASASRSLLPLGARVAKIVILAMAAVALLSLLGYPVASLIAGLGLGGLALALAAQKTVENLFGAFSLGVDQPFRQGDFVKVEDFVGTVELIGLRSTRFRTLDRTLITMPNGRLADMRLESFTARDRIRLAAIIGLEYRTTARQLREVLAGFERALREHPKIWPDAVVVRFREFAASSLDIEVMAWFETPDWNEFQLIRQEVLLQFMDVVEQAGASFAFPTRTVHLVEASPGDGRSPRATDAGDRQTSDTA
jgi:MscS family membrane protein